MTIPIHPVQVERFEYAVIAFDQGQSQQAADLCGKEMIRDKAKNKLRIFKSELDQYTTQTLAFKVVVLNIEIS